MRLYRKNLLSSEFSNKNMLATGGSNYHNRRIGFQPVKQFKRQAGSLRLISICCSPNCPTVATLELLVKIKLSQKETSMIQQAKQLMIALVLLLPFSSSVFANENSPQLPQQNRDVEIATQASPWIEGHRVFDLKRSKQDIRDVTTYFAFKSETRMAGSFIRIRF